MAYSSYNRGFRRGLRIPQAIRLNIISNLAIAAVVGVVGLFLLVIILFVVYSRDLPSPDKVQSIDNLSSVIYDRNGEVLYDVYNNKNRIPLPLHQIPTYLREATVAVEDKNFYKHSGIDSMGIVRAMFRIVTFGGVEGGSTLTQQLVKNVLLTNERTLPRKIKEFILTVQIERKYTKDEILQMYLNEAPYGGTAWGVETAAETYFAKHAKDLTLVESAILAGLPQLPSVYSPFGSDPKAYLWRTQQVLRRMREDGYITQEQEKEADKQLPKVQFTKDNASFKAPHFVIYVKKLLEEKFGANMVEQGGLRVTTTLDLRLQEQVEKIVSEEIDKLKGLKVGNGAAVVIDPKTGEILALVGSKDYFSKDPEFQGKFDVATQGLRQPGSALKPITYATAFSKGFSGASVVMDVETHYPGGIAGQPDYIPKNYDGKYRGPVQLRFALGNSINIPAVKLTAWVGIKDILQNAYSMGINSLAPTDDTVRRLGLSITLGGGEVTLLDLTSAYGVFATNGVKQPVINILKVTDVRNRTLLENKPTDGKKVLDSGIAFLISHILLDNNARKDIFGVNSYLVVPGRTVSVKTGTTDDKRDNWTVGYTPSVVVGVWVGNNDNSQMDAKLASGVTGASPIWNRIMREVLKNIPDETPKVPDNVIAKEIDAFGGGLPKDGMPTRSEYFLKGTEPTSISPIYKKLKVSKDDDKKLASIVDVATGKFNEKDFYVFLENDPISTDGKNRFQEAIDVWTNGQSDSKYHVPRDTQSGDPNQVVVGIKKPSDNTQIDSNDIEIRAEASAVSGIKKMEIYIDEELKKTVDRGSLDETITLDVGIHKIKVVGYSNNDHTGDTSVTIGVKTSPNVTPTPSPTP